MGFIQTYLKVFTHLLDDVGHTVPVGQLDVVSSIHQALVTLQHSLSLLSINENSTNSEIIMRQFAVPVQYHRTNGSDTS